MTDVNEIAYEVISKMKDVHIMYHRLVLLVGPMGSGKTRVLREVERLTGAPRVNLSLELSKRLLNLSQKERSQKAATVFQDMLSGFRREDGTPFETVLLDNIEILFDASLELNALQLIQQVSRSTTLVVGWPGRVRDGFLTYAEPGHPEYQRHPARGLVLVTLEDRPSNSGEGHQ